MYNTVHHHNSLVCTKVLLVSFSSNHQHRVLREAIGYEDLNYHIEENITGTRAILRFCVMGNINVPHNHVCLDVITESTR